MNIVRRTCYTAHMQYVIKKTEAQIVKEGNSQFHEYGLPFADFSVGVSEIDGRYPEIGFDVDEAIDAYWYIESGKGTMWIAGQEYSLEPGDMIAVPKGEKYWIHGEALRMVVCSNPSWYPEQHGNIKE